MEIWSRGTNSRLLFGVNVNFNLSFMWRTSLGFLEYNKDKEKQPTIAFGKFS